MLLIPRHHPLRVLPLLAALALPRPLPAQAVSAQPPAASALDEHLPQTEAMGSTLIARGRYVAALGLLRGLDPKTASVYNKMGIACEHMYMAAEAREDFEPAVRLDPRYGEAWNNLGTVFHTAGDLKRAERFYKKALRVDPRNSIAEVNLGTLYYSKGKYRKGDLFYRRALAMDPRALQNGALNSVGAPTGAKGLAELRYRIAKNYAEAGENDLALETLEKAISSGFRDKKRLREAPEGATLRKTAAFGSLMADLAGG